MSDGEDDGDRALLDVEEVARYLGVAPISVYRWCRTGRLAAVKVGRVRRAALDDLLRREEQPGTLAAQLGTFLRVPDQVLAIAPNLALLHRLDAAFLQAGVAYDGALLKLYGGETDTPAVLREAFARNGLDARGLETAGRLRLLPAPPLAAGAAEARRARRALRAEDGPAGRPLRVSVDWVQPVGVDLLLQEQAALAEVVGPRPVVRKLAVLEAVADTWPPGQRRRVQEAQQGLIGLSPSRLWLSRGAPLLSA